MFYILIGMAISEMTTKVWPLGTTKTAEWAVIMKLHVETEYMALGVPVFSVNSVTVRASILFSFWCHNRVC